MKKKFKIFLFNPYPGLGGVDATIFKFIKSLNLNRIEVEYLSLKKVKYFKNKKIIYTKIDSKSTFLSFFEMLKIIKKDKHEKKVFFSLQYFVNVWSILFIKLVLGVKIFIYEVNHLNELNYHKDFKEFVKKKIIKFLVKILYKYPDIVAGNSSELVKDLEKYTNRRVYKIYNPCFDSIKPRLRKYNPQNKINILNISRFEKQKDHLTLIKAINNTKNKHRINLILVGYGSKLKEIKNYVYSNKINTKFFLRESKISKFYKKSDLYICTSLYEGLPTTMIEAASYCLPIISSNFKSGSNEILSNGKSGYIFKVGDFRKLSKYIDEFYYNPKKFYKKEKFCRKTLSSFSVKKNSEIFSLLIRKLF
tara:strand:+ start:1550 stop:2638 length:1089 start_codon:yes stop_codon:yes gene_type:complete